MVSTGGTIERTTLTRTQEPSEHEPSSSIDHRKEAEPIVIDGGEDIYSIALLADGEHIVSGGGKGKIRRWRVEDGMEVGTPMDTGSPVVDIAVSRDGNWIVGGTRDGRVTVWSAESHSKMTEFRAHDRRVLAVDVSPDATKIATGLDDGTVCVWSLSTGWPLLGPLKHKSWVLAVKFSPDGRLVATTTLDRDSVRVYDSQNGSLLVDLPVKVPSDSSQCLAWASDSKQFFVPSYDGNIHHVDGSAGTTLSKRHIHSGSSLTCIALASNETFIAASAGSSVSFWDMTSHEQIGTVIECTHDVWSMAMSSDYDLVTCEDKTITLRALRGILPSRYLDNVSVPAQKKTGNRKSLYSPLQSPRTPEIQKTKKIDDSPGTFICTLIPSFDTMSIRRENSVSRTNHSGTAQPARRISTNTPGEGLPHPVATRPRGELEYAPRCVDPYLLDSRLLGSNNARLEKTVQELRDTLAESRRAANQEKDRLSVRLSTSISTKTYVSLTLIPTRQQNYTSRTGQRRTPHPTCRGPTQSS